MVEIMLLPICVMCLLILLLIFLLKKLRQPYFVAYILAGLLLGPDVSKIFNDAQGISSLGEIGVLLMMFFLGMEIEIPDKKSFLYKPLVAQGVKTLLSLGFAMLIAFWMAWGKVAMLMLTLTLVFNSTAVVSEFLRKNGEFETPMGKTVLNILLLQDVMLAPTLTFFKFAGRGHIAAIRLVFSLLGCLLLFLLLRAIRNRNLFQLPIFKQLEQDHEIQVFLGALLCLGFALLASFAGLSGAVGSFAAGIYIGRTNAFNWLEEALKPFKVFFVALFFVSVGLMIDVKYVETNLPFIMAVVFLVMLINSLLSAVVFRLLKYPWKDSIAAGALLSQTGEFGLIACSIAHTLGIIDLAFFKAAVAVVGLSLLFSTGWITVLRKAIYAGKQWVLFDQKNN